ncbi:MAG: type II secretion system F family protein [Pseudohongiellaceae bacterium]
MDGILVSLVPSVASLAAFFAVLLGCIGIYLLRGYRSEKVRRRVQHLTGEQSGETRNLKGHTQKDGEFLVHWLEPMGEMILPKDEWRRSVLRTQLVYAGYRNARAVYIHLGAKLFFGVGFPVAVATLFVISGNIPLMLQMWSLVALVMAGGIGFVLPDQILRIKIRQRRLEYIEGFPDALDMLVVCVEAGLGLDASIDRVAGELRHSYPALASELSLNSLEVRAGKSRQEALHSLAERMNIDQVQALSTILIQAERFGTSIAAALRNFSEEMRVERMQRARETAAKLPVKMIFPIVLFIFPALFLVLLGPAVVRIITGFS